MTPPNPTDLSRLKGRGGKLLVYHGTADPIFSSSDTATWYEALSQANGGDATNFARYFEVPGMNHCSGGPTTDNFEMLARLVDWVERGQAPDNVTASVRAGNVDRPASWSTTRSRPLCPYPKTARYKGTGSFESADSFSCQ
jgi:feruloyl esterase